LKIAGRAPFQSRRFAAWPKGNLQKKWPKGATFWRASPSRLRYLSVPDYRLWPFWGARGILVNGPPEDGCWVRTLKEHFIIAQSPSDEENCLIAKNALELTSASGLFDLMKPSNMTAALE
jgi:hypothetical protein